MQTTLSIEVVAFETDFGGVVSNTRYIEYIERGRYALLHAAGLRVENVWREYGVQPIVRRVEIEYLGFARHEDRLQLRVWVASHGGATTTLSYELCHEDNNSTLMRATQTLAYLNRDWKPTRVPRVFLDALIIESATT